MSFKVQRTISKRIHLTFTAHWQLVIMNYRAQLFLQCHHLPQMMFRIAYSSVASSMESQYHRRFERETSQDILAIYIFASTRHFMKICHAILPRQDQGGLSLRSIWLKLGFEQFPSTLFDVTWRAYCGMFKQTWSVLNAVAYPTPNSTDEKGQPKVLIWRPRHCHFFFLGIPSRSHR